MMDESSVEFSFTNPNDQDNRLVVFLNRAGGLFVQVENDGLPRKN